MGMDLALPWSLLGMETNRNCLKETQVGKVDRARCHCRLRCIDNARKTLRNCTPQHSQARSFFFSGEPHLVRGTAFLVDCMI